MNVFRVSVGLGLALAMSAAASAQSVVVPNANATAHGNGGLNTIVRDSGNPRTYQMQYGAAQLSSINVGDQITGVQFRLQTSAANATSWPAGPVTWPDFEITMAQAANAMGAMSTTFAANMTSPLLVHDGPLTLQAGAYPGGAVTPAVNGWSVVYTFQTPYTYQGGDLVMLIAHPGSDAVANNRFLDALTTTGPGYGTAIRAFSGTGFNVPTGAQTSATITQFQYIPEPASMVLLVAGALFALRRR